MNSAIRTTAEQTVDGLKWGEECFIIGLSQKTRDSILEVVKEISKFPFYYFKGEDHYVLYASKCIVVNESGEQVDMVWPTRAGKNKILTADTYKNCRRYIGRQRGIQKLELVLKPDRDDEQREHHCFYSLNNYED